MHIELGQQMPEQGEDGMCIIDLSCVSVSCAQSCSRPFFM